jgi:hypothetical protein
MNYTFHVIKDFIKCELCGIKKLKLNSYNQSKLAKQRKSVPIDYVHAESHGSELYRISCLICDNPITFVSKMTSDNRIIPLESDIGDDPRWSKVG